MNQSETKFFYDSIPAFTRFSEVTDPAHYHKVPDDWYVIITDVKGSTDAIAANRYKEVNMLGASSIVAILNVVKRKVPFVFGGDGATVLVHKTDLDVVRPALIATLNLARRNFGMEIRAGIVSVAELLAKNTFVEVAKLKLSDLASLAMLRGGGLSLAEKWIKSEADGHRYLVRPDQEDMPKIFEGLSCRWSPIPAQRGEMLSLLVVVTAAPDLAGPVYQEVLLEIERILGGDASKPVMLGNLDPSIKLKNLSNEIRMRGLVRWSLASPTFAFKSFINYLFVHGSYRLGLVFSGFNAKRYVDDLIASTDYQKFDDMLRMIRDCSSESRKELERYLEAKRREGKIAYGLHSSSHALMTCLVFSLSDHVHFIDGSDGGYAMAAKQLKNQLKK